MTFQIKHYDSVYQDQIERLYDEGLAIEGAFYDDPETDSDLQNISEVYLEGGIFIVGFSDDKLIAMAALKRHSGHVAEIKRFRVDYNYHRMGFGAKIYDYLENYARKAGFGLLTLETTSNQISAIEFYLKRGFAITKQTKFDGFEVLEYQKDLD